MKHILFLIVLLSSCKQTIGHRPPTLYLVGDSTMSKKLESKRPETGWGEMLTSFFSDDIVIENHAKNGRSTKSFLLEKRWEEVVKKLNSGDYVFIQFGHNDSSIKKKERYTTLDEYKTNLEKFVNDARAKGATPVLLTPIMRRRFDEKGEFYDTHADYPMVVRDLAAAKGLPLIDAHTLSKEAIVKLGEEGSKSLFLWLKNGEHPNYPDGLIDNTHLSPVGAQLIASLVAHEIRKSTLPLRHYLITSE